MNDVSIIFLTGVVFGAFGLVAIAMFWAWIIDVIEYRRKLQADRLKSIVDEAIRKFKDSV